VLAHFASWIEELRVPRKAEIEKFLDEHNMRHHNWRTIKDACGSRVKSKKIKLAKKDKNNTTDK